MINNIIIKTPIKLDEDLIEKYEGNIFLYDFDELLDENCNNEDINDSLFITSEQPPIIFDEIISSTDNIDTEVELSFNDSFPIITDEIEF